MSSSHKACPECGSGEFWVLPDGTVICANDDCHARTRDAAVSQEDLHRVMEALSLRGIGFRDEETEDAYGRLITAAGVE